jgi:cell division protein FtsL
MQRAIGAINWVLMLATLASAVTLYVIKNDTRRLEVRVLAQERALDRAQNDVTVLTAERAHLARPARLEVLARAIGMSPITADQYLRLDINRRDVVPSPLVGEGQGGGDGRTSEVGIPPTPNPSPQGGGESRDASGGPASQPFRGR